MKLLIWITRSISKLNTCLFCEICQWQLCAQPGEDLDSPVPPPGRPELGNAPDVYTDKCSIRSSPIRDNDSSLANKNNIPTNHDSKPVSNTASNFENQTTCERSSEVRINMPFEIFIYILINMVHKNYTET